MKISLITPTHDIRWLKDTYRSIQAQDHQDWEWVLVPNGARAVEIEATLRQQYTDPRIRISPDITFSTHVGALKKFACDSAKGDVFAELDHDDMLMPGILSKLVKTFDKGAGFAFSDSALFEVDGHSWGYHPSHGWQHYQVTAYGRRYVATHLFPVSPRSLCEVYYCPDHIRAWSRFAYYTAGGHDDKLSVGDDHDLICRTYLTGVPFVHVGGCGYLYRWHDANTVHARGAKIKEQNALNRRKYLLKLVREWCRREKHPVVDLLGMYKAGDWYPGNPLPLPDESQGQIVCSDILQFAEPAQIVPFFNDAYRALVPGGYLHVVVPSENGRYASMNPLHKVRFNLNSFLYYSRREFAANLPGVECRFDLVGNEEIYPDDGSGNFQKYDMKMLVADMCALKGQRQPGPDLI